MVSSRSSIINVLSSDTVVTSAGVMSDSDIVRDGDAILSSTRESYNANDEDHRVNKVSGAIEWSQSDPPSLLSMSVNLHELVNSNFQDSKRYSIGKSEGTDAIVVNVAATTVPDITVAATTAVATISNSNGNCTCTSTSTIGNTSDLTACTVKFSRNNHEEESYEGFGSVEDDGVDSPGGGSSSAPSPTGPNSLKNSKSPNSSIGRHSWLRTSLRRTPPCSGRKRLSSNALASQLYRSGSFNSSGRGSNCDPTDDMYSDVSLEDDVIDLNHRVQMIQEQMHALVDTQSAGEERYARAKQENATLQARILMLEEAAKDAEARAEERLQAEQRRHREWVCRLERERQLQLENYAIKLQAAELEGSSLRDEIGRLREQLERTKAEKARLERSLEESRREVEAARENERQAIGRANETHHMLRVAREELSMRIEDQQRLEDLVQQVAQLRARNKSLEESRDELQAAAALQAGRELLMLKPCSSNLEKGASLAVELLAGMDQDQMDGHTSADAQSAEPCTLLEMKQALREQQEVNTQLRAYIDGILLNIVENYPQLLEVKQTH